MGTWGDTGCHPWGSVWYRYDGVGGKLRHAGGALWDGQNCSLVPSSPHQLEPRQHPLHSNDPCKHAMQKADAQRPGDVVGAPSSMQTVLQQQLVMLSPRVLSLAILRELI